MSTEGKSVDSILEFFVEASNRHGFSLDITLNMKGSMVSGTTISAKEYFEILSEKFEDGKEVAQQVSKKLANASETAEENSEKGASFIHLKNTRIYCGDSKPTPSNGKIVWRGKLNEVDGFFLGKISESKSKSSKSDKK